MPSVPGQPINQGHDLMHTALGELSLVLVRHVKLPACSIATDTREHVGAFRVIVNYQLLSGAAFVPVPAVCKTTGDEVPTKTVQPFVINTADLILG